MTDAQKNKLDKFKKILSYLFSYEDYNKSFHHNSNANFQIEEIANLYLNEVNETITIVLEGDRDHLEFPFISLNRFDYSTLCDYLQENIKRLAQK